MRRSIGRPSSRRFGGQLGAVPGAVLAGGAVELARFDRCELAVCALGGEDDEVGVQLGVGDAAGLLVLGEAAGGVDELGGEQALGALEAHDPAALAPHQGDLALDPRQRARHRPSVGGLDLGAAVGTGGAHSAETDFGGAIISSTPATRVPLEPAGRSGSPVSGEKPCITARRSLRSTGLSAIEAERAQRGLASRASGWAPAFGVAQRRRGCSSRRGWRSRSGTSHTSSRSRQGSCGSSAPRRT